MDVEENGSQISKYTPSQSRGHSRTPSNGSYSHSRGSSRAPSRAPGHSVHSHSVSVSLEMLNSRAAIRSTSGKLTEACFSPAAVAFLNLAKLTARQHIRKRAHIYKANQRSFKVNFNN
jgi:hypothetical protein